MNWKSSEQKETAKKIMAILSRKRAGPTDLFRDLRKLKENGAPIYKDQSDWKETIKEIKSSRIPVEKKTDSGLLYRSDIDYSQRKGVIQ